MKPVPDTGDSLQDAARLERPGGVYAAFGAWHGRRVVKLSDHFDRLQDSARRVGFDLSIDRRLVCAELCEIMERAGLDGARIRLSAHPDDLAALPAAPLLVAMEPYIGPPATVRERGVSCRTVAHTARANPRAKQTSWLAGRARFRGDPDNEPYEWLLLDDEDRILEGASSNFYAIRSVGDQAVLQTAEEGVLAGISRSIVLDIAPGLVRPEFKAVPRTEVAQIAEAFITSASRGIVPVVEIDGMPISGGVPGAITRALMARYDHRAEELEEPLCSPPTGGAISTP